MIKSNQFGSQGPRAGADAKACAQFEAMLADAVDGLLTPEEQATFADHAASCTGCGVQLAEAQRGAAWLTMLKAHPPEPDAALVTRILAETSVRTAAEQDALRAQQRADAEQISLLGSSLRVQAAAPAAIANFASGVLPFRTRMGLRLRPITHTVLQPRFMMTAAMAFFSIALTLNVTGVRLNQIRASDLKPASLRRNFYQANAHVVRYYDNLRVVYELESRVHDLQHSSDESVPAPEYPAAPAPDTPGSKQKDATPGGGTPKSGGPAGKDPEGVSNRPAPSPKSGSSRREFASQPMVQVACAGERPRPNPAAFGRTAVYDVRNRFERVL